MADSSVPVTAGAGTNIDTRTNAQGEHRQVMILGEGATQSDVIAAMRPDGFLNVRLDPSTLLFDTFESVDTANAWTIGGTVPPTGSAGTVSASPGTAAGATTYGRSQPAFTPGSSAFLQFAAIIQLEAAALTGSTRWWGLGVPNLAPTATTPITNGAVFEVRAADGLLYGAVYSNGVLTQSVPLVRPADGALHRYQVLYRASRVYFNIDNVEVGNLPFPNPTVGALPASFGAVNGAAALATAPVLNVSLVGVGDTASNNTQLSDGTYPWRRAKIDATGNLQVNLTGSGGALAQTSGSITAAGPNTPGVASTASSTGQVVANVALAGNATFHLVTSNFVGTLIFEASVDAGLNYGPVGCVREDGSGSETGTAISAAAALIRQYTTGMPGMTYFRVRAVAYTSGTVSVVIAPGPFLIEPTPSLAASTAVIGTTRDLVSGQNRTIFSAQALGGTLTATDTMVGLTPYRSGTAGTAGSSITVTAGKTLRIQSISLTIIGNGTTAAATAASARLRYANSTSTTASSPMVDEISINIAAQLANRGSANLVFGQDGFEIPAGYSLGISVVGIASGTYDVTIKGYEF